MSLFAAVAGLLVLLALAALLWPLMRPSAAAEGGAAVVAVFRQQLADLEVELGQGAVTAEDAAASRIEITRHLLAAADRREAAAGSGETAWRVGAAAAIAAFVPLGAFVLYVAVGTPAALDPAAATAAAAPHSRAELAAGAAALERQLRRAPEDVDRWMLLGGTDVALGRYDAASAAYRHALALAPNDPELHAALGETLVLAAGGAVTPAALAEFAKAPADLRSRYYRAQAAWQQGDAATARRRLEALLAAAPADAPWREIVAAQLARIAPAAAAPPAMPGPDAPAVAAAAKTTPAEQRAMIAGMVGRLAARLEADPNDAKGWLMLARSYTVLGRAADALGALARGSRAVPADLPLETAYLEALAQRDAAAAPSPELARVAARVAALDNKQPEALWYLGLAAAKAGERKAAAGYYSRLLALLPQGGRRRALVQQHLDALR